MNTNEIYLTQRDFGELTDLVDVHIYDRQCRDRASLQRLAQELARAIVVPAGQIPPDVITMNSEARVRDIATGHEMKLVVTWPEDADPVHERISVLAPLGMALLGCRKGQRIEWSTPGGQRHLRVEEVLYQPEADPRPAASPARRFMPTASSA